MTTAQTDQATVLIVDDSLTVRMALAAMLESDGHRVQMASNGSECLAILETGGIDVLVLDLIMPGMTGVDVLHRLKATPELASIPVLMLTAVADRAELVACLDLGADDYVVKPWDERELTGRLRSLVRLKCALDSAKQAQIAAETATAAKSIFLANMSHEVRTPISGIVGMTDLLGESTLSAEQREYVETVRTCGEHLLSVVNETLDFSKIEAGKLELELLDEDLRSVVEKTADILAVTAQKKGVELCCFVDPAVPRQVRVDPGRLRQVLINLAGNAVKFTERGQVAIEVTLLREGNDRVTLRFDVRDSGIGIPEDRLDSLFEQFSQVDASTTRKYGGTGLGLAIAKRLVELMDGAIHVESVPGEGTTFWFTVILERQVGTHEAASDHGELAGKRVLIADDNETSRRILRDYAKHLGCRVETSECAGQVVPMMQAAARDDDSFYALLIEDTAVATDIACQLATDPNLANTSRIQVTTTARRAEIREVSPSFDHSLLKPVKYDLLADCLSNTEQPTKESPNAPKTSAEGEGVRVLLAEDNPTNQKLAQWTIEGRLGYELHIVSNGVEALEALTSGSYDLILMDCQMPVMDGFETTRAIRDPNGEVHDAAIPIIAMTANAMPGDRDHCLAAGMTDYVSKPIRSSVLAEVIARNLRLSDS